MSYKEKISMVYIVTGVIVAVIYGLVLYQHYHALALNVTNDFKFWGIAFLILLPAIVVPQLIVYFVFALINIILAKEKPPTFTDELDKFIDLKMYRNSFLALVLGMFISMALLVANFPPRAAFIALIISVIASSIFGDITKLYYLKRGF